MQTDYKSKGLLLLKKGQKGIFHAIFSRFGLILILLLLQFFILFGTLRWFEGFIPHILGGNILFTFIIVLCLLNSKMDPSAKITWLIVIMLAPVFGVLLFAYTQSDIGHRVLKRYANRIIADTKECIPQSEDTMKRLAEADRGVATLAHYMHRSGCHPVFENTSVTYFPWVRRSLRRC